MENKTFSIQGYNELLCTYLQALGDDLLLDNTADNNKRGQFILNIRSRIKNGMKLTKKQNNILQLIEKELANQLTTKDPVEVGNVQG